MDRRTLTGELRNAFAWQEGERADPSGWWRDPNLLRELVLALASLHPGSDPTVVIGIESRGTLLGPLVAQELRVGFVEIRKHGEAQHARNGELRRAAPPDYSQRDLTLSMRKGLVGPRDRVLLIDDWIETGAQAQAASRLVEDSAAAFLGVAVIVDETTAAVRHALKVRSLLSARQLP